MNHIDIARAWKDEAYRDSLTEAQRAELPENPAGLVEISDADLREVNGGSFLCSAINCSWACSVFCTGGCTTIPFVC